MGSKKKELILSLGQTWCQKKCGIPKKKYESKRGTHTFFGPNIVPKKYRVKKRNSYFLRAKHCAKKIQSKKKGTHTFFGPNIVTSMGPKKNSISSTKKEVVLFRAKHCQKQEWDPKKRMSSKKKKELILLGTFWRYFFSVWTENNFKQKTITWKNGFCRYFILFEMDFSSNAKKVPPKSTQKYEFLFFWNPY